MFRIGGGYDFHRFAQGRPMVLGGVEIPHEVGLDGHSDADVVLHAICDALLGALALGDIGQHFPNNDPRYRNISSRRLLRAVYDKIKAAGYAVVNVDVVVIADHPRLAPHIPEMRRCIAEDLALTVDGVSVKATTQEGCAPEGIATHAVALLSGERARESR